MAQKRRKRADGVFPGEPTSYTNAVFQAVSSLGRRHSRAAAFAAAALFWIVTAMLASHLPARRARAWTRLWPSAGNK